ncbi:hypothetical protein [Kistimonas asteriae]|uniref:hypothetical protein n=1 Tax=Kistimonas asteriae TaxID=517724 RepID=UPI001BA99EA1|nr:hypothetical protein [Kistimonas asteriae]
MDKEYRQAICGPTSEMVRFIKENNVDIAIERLEELDGKVKSIRHSLHPEFLVESKTVREKLKDWFRARDESDKKVIH